MFTNLNTVQGGVGPTIRGSNFTFQESVAEAFAPAANYILTGAEAWFFGGGFGGAVDFAIYSNAGNVPGTLLARLGTASIPANADMLFSESTPSNTLELFANVSYWLVLSPATPSTDVLWLNRATSSPLFAFTTDVTGTSGWSAQGSNTAQFQIDGTPVSSVPGHRVDCSWPIAEPNRCKDPLFIRFCLRVGSFKLATRSDRHILLDSTAC